MAIWNHVKAKLNKDSTWFLSSLAAYGSAELLVRVIRIVAVIVIARAVSPEIMGLAALSLSLFELVRVLANAGIGQKIILASASQLPATANTAHRLFWIWCMLVAIVQLCVAALLHIAFEQTDAALMLAVLSAVYLFMPGGLVQVFLLMRDGKMATTARIAASQTIADHLLTMIFVILWPSAWAIVLPKLLTAPIWLIAVRRARSWKYNAAKGTAPARYFVTFSLGVLGSEMLTASRMHLDKLVVGSVLGVKALGIYYFAFNAGLGITTSFVTAFSTILFPHLCEVKDGVQRLQRYRRSFFLGAVIFFPLILAQAAFAPIYVPLVFGQQWNDAAPLVSILSLAAIPIFFGAANTAWLRASGRISADLMIVAFTTSATLLYFALGAQMSLQMAVIGYVLGLVTNFIPISILIFRHAHQQLRIQYSSQQESLI
ncbi:oligosaccharide flippase family protein [Parasphingorhabdus sp.]